MNRRDFLKILVSLPVLGGLLLFVSPLFRYLRPTTGPLTDIRFDLKNDPTQWKGEKGIVGPPDLPEKDGQADARGGRERLLISSIGGI